MSRLIWASPMEGLSPRLSWPALSPLSLISAASSMRRGVSTGAFIGMEPKENGIPAGRAGTRGVEGVARLLEEVRLNGTRLEF